MRNAVRNRADRAAPPPVAGIAWLALVVLALPILLGVPSGPSARAAGEGRPVDAVQTPELAAIRQRAAEAQVSLLAATAAYEAGQTRLAQAVTQAMSERRRARAARLRVTASQESVDALLRSAYKSGVSPALSLLVASGEQDADSLLDAATYLGQVTQSSSDVLRDHLLARKVADELQQAAGQAVAEATAQERALGAQVEALRAQAAQAQADLEALMQRLIAEQEARERAARLARERAAREEARRLAAARPAAADVTARCSGGSAAGSTAWSSYPNGLIPPAALCPLSVPGHMLRADAAQGFERLAAAYREALGRTICLSDSYRSYAEQVRLYREKPSLAAVPGTSNHGWGLAVDLCGGMQSFGTPDQAWMRANAGRYGWFHPSWAEPGGSRPEPWHWEYGTSS